MNRLDLSWALNAVLPHAGTAKQGLDHVALTYDKGSLYAYATDKYTAGIARVNDGPMTVFDVKLSTKEATDLMRFVRPDRVGERETPVEMMLADTRDELHVGFDNWEGEFESEVFEVAGTPALDLDYLLSWIRRLNDVPELDDNLIVRPKLIEKFAKAARTDTDRLWILPRHAGDRHGAAVVAVGADFIGAIAGLTYDDLGDAMVASFLTTERNAA